MATSSRALECLRWWGEKSQTWKCIFSGLNGNLFRIFITRFNWKYNVFKTSYGQIVFCWLVVVRRGRQDLNVFSVKYLIYKIWNYRRPCTIKDTMLVTKWGVEDTGLKRCVLVSSHQFCFLESWWATLTLSFDKHSTVDIWKLVVFTVICCCSLVQSRTV